MDAVKYFKTKAKMCSSFESCNDCPLDEINKTSDVNCFESGREEEAVAIVEKWAAEHPIKTRQSEFLKMFPNIRRVHNTDIIDVCPRSLRELSSDDCLRYAVCLDCKKDYWFAELPEEENRQSEKAD